MTLIYRCVYMGYYCPHIWPMYARMYGPLLPLYMAYSCPYIWAMYARMYGLFLPLYMAYHIVAKIISKVGPRAAPEPPFKHIYSSA